MESSGAPQVADVDVFDVVVEKWMAKVKGMVVIRVTRNVVSFMLN